uniref:Uncharacterized protein n=1 Tax=Oryza brachyantha TaxID=4533 RepID=J3NBU0_ORYBR
PDKANASAAVLSRDLAAPRRRRSGDGGGHRHRQRGAGQGEEEARVHGGVRGGGLRLPARLRRVPLLPPRLQPPPHLRLRRLLLDLCRERPATTIRDVIPV